MDKIKIGVRLSYDGGCRKRKNHIAPVSGFSGWRLNLDITKIEDSGGLLEKTKASIKEIVSTEAASMVRHVGYFRVTEVYWCPPKRWGVTRKKLIS